MSIATLVCTLLAVNGPGLQVEVDGSGLLRFARAGRAVYAKKATLTVASGRLGSNGCELLPAVRVPADAIRIEADLEGNLYARRTDGRQKIGKLVLALFPDEGALLREGGFLVAQDRPTLGEAGQDLFGVIRQPSVEPKMAAKTVSRKAETQVVVLDEEGAAPPKAVETPVVTTHPKTVKPKPLLKTPVATYRSSQRLASELPTIAIKPSSEAKGDKFLLGEIADISADDAQKASLETTPIGDTPTVGVIRGIDAPSVTAALSRAGWKLGTYVLNMTPGAKVRRQAQEVTDEQIVQVALEAVQSQLKILAPMHNDIHNQPMSCPLGELSLKAESCTKAGLGARVSVAVYVDGRRINARTIQLSPDKEAVGISRDQRVKVIVHAAGAVVETAGKAKDQAWAGQQVSVVTETGAVLTGTVTSDGSVEVSL